MDLVERLRALEQERERARELYRIHNDSTLYFLHQAQRDTSRIMRAWHNFRADISWRKTLRYSDKVVEYSAARGDLASTIRSQIEEHARLFGYRVHFQRLPAN